MGAPVHNVIWRPNSAPQRRFIELGSYEGLYGGAAGGGKSEALMFGLLRYAHLRDYTGILFRRTFEELDKYIIRRSQDWFPRCFPGASYNSTKHRWDFPSGARVLFGHLQHEDDVRAHQSAEYQHIAFDELTSFLESQYRFLLSRARSSAGIPVMIRSGTNPGGIGHGWVKRRFAPWLDTDKCVTKGEPGKPLYYVNEQNGERWVPKGTPHALSRVFVPARLEDNPALMVNDPTYGTRLMGLDPVTRQQLRHGDWGIQVVPGTLFRKEWFGEPIESDQVPRDLKRMRYWDRAATAVTSESPDPDWTRGLLLSHDDETGITYLEHMESLRDVPGAVKALIKDTAKKDGRRVTVALEQDPAQAGKFEISEYVTYLKQFDVQAFPARKDKAVRARPVSAQAHNRKVKIVRGHWNQEFLDEVEAFPSTLWHDDQVDVLSGGYNAIVGTETSAAEDWLAAARNNL